MINLIMPTYYGGNLLRDALNSLTAQSKRTFVVTVVDDCSPNNIEKIVNEFENKLHINYIRSETNGGPGSARQAGLDFADEKWFNYVMFMDEDDVLPPWSIELLSAEAQRGNADFVSGAILEQRLGKTHTISCNNSTWLHGKIYKLSFLRENNIRFISDLNEDAAFNAQCTIVAKRTGTLELPMYYWRNNKESITRGQDFMVNKGYSFPRVLSEALYLQRKHFKNNPDFVMKDLIAIYKHYYHIKANDKIETEKVESNHEWITKLFSTPEAQELINTEDFLYYLQKEMTVVAKIGDKVFFYPPFNEFLNKFTNDNLTFFKS